jgi:hypothetical protein
MNISDVETSQHGLCRQEYAGPTMLGELSDHGHVDVRWAQNQMKSAEVSHSQRC